MKKTILIILSLLPIPTYATTMCAKNDSVAVVLDPSISSSNSNDYSFDDKTGIWWAQFPYGLISGISACLNTGSGKRRGYTEPMLTDTDNKTVVGSEKNGQYCWCKMTHPASSQWVFIYDDGSKERCSSRCPYICGVNPVTYEDARIGLFGSISN